jgi:hypothetical protein
LIRFPSLHLPLGLTFLLCAAAFPGPAHAQEAESLFAGCRAEPYGGDGWSYECGDFRAAISDHAGISAKRLWASSRRAFKGKSARGMAFKEEKATLAGRKVRLLRMRAKSPEAWEASVFTVLPVKGKGARRVLCKAGNTPEQQARCGQVLERLAGYGWKALPEAGVAVVQSESALAGRELSAPDGCHLTAENGSGRIECGDGSRLDWKQLPEASRLGAFVRDGVRTFKEVSRTSWMESRLPCVVDGARTECTFLRMLDPSGRRDAYFAGAVVRGVPTFIACVAGTPSPRLLQACQQVLRFR